MIAVARATQIEQKDADVGRPQQAHHCSDRLLGPGRQELKGH